MFCFFWGGGVVSEILTVLSRRTRIRLTKDRQQPAQQTETRPQARGPARRIQVSTGTDKMANEKKNE